MSFLDSIPSIFRNRRQIWEGLRNKTFKKDDIEKVYEVRMAICRECRLYDTTGSGCAATGSTCCNKNLFEEIDGKLIKGCGCDLSIKGRALSSACPLAKWPAILTEKEEEMLNRQLDENKG